MSAAAVASRLVAPAHASRMAGGRRARSHARRRALRDHLLHERRRLAAREGSLHPREVRRCCCCGCGGVCDVFLCFKPQKVRLESHVNSDLRL